MKRRSLAFLLMLAAVAPAAATSLPWRSAYGVRETLRAGLPAPRIPVHPTVRVLLYEGDDALLVALPQGGELASGDRHVTVPPLATLKVRRHGGTTEIVLARGKTLLATRQGVEVTPRGQKSAGPALKAVGADQIVAFEGHPYRGCLALRPQGADTLAVVNQVALEAYLYGVVPRELNTDTLEAVKAQAVVSRTYALGHLHPGEPWDVVRDVRAQAYGGLAVETVKSCQAVDQTAGQVLTWKGALAREVCFHAACGGRTASNEAVFDTRPVAYLQPVADQPETGSGDAFLDETAPTSYCSGSPYYRWTVRWKREALEESLRRALKVPASAGALVGLAPVTAAADGRVQKLRVTFERTSRLLSGEAIRAALAFAGGDGRPRRLYSTCFTVSMEGDTVVARGRGWGHGVGMCQWGAIGMARQGRTYDEILRHYFPGTELTSVR